MDFLKEPWLKWAPPIAQRGEKVAPPSKPFPVYTLTGKQVGTKEVYGPLAKLDGIIVEFLVEGVDRGFRDFLSSFHVKLEKAKALFPGYQVTPTNASWSKGDLVRVLLTREFTFTGEAPFVGRLGALLAKLDGRSFRLSSNACLDYCRDEWYAEFDSVYFVKEGALEYTPSSRVIQMYGVRPDIDINRPTPIVWGIGLILPDDQWEVVSAGADSKATILSAAKKYIKYADTTSYPADGYELWATKEAFVSHRASLTQEDRQAHQLTAEAKKWLAEIRKENAVKIYTAFSKLAEGDTAPLLGLIAPTLEEFYSMGEDEFDPLTITAAQNALWANGPVRGDRLGELYKILVKNLVWRMSVPGVTAFSFPSAYLGEQELILPSSCRQSVTVGTKVTDIRFPNTGTSMVPMVVTGFSHLPVVIGNPSTGKSFQNEDYDGDISIVVFKEMIENRDWLPPVPKVPEIGDHNPQSQVVYAAYSKLAIGLCDYLLCGEVIGGHIDGIAEARLRVQQCVDMAKKKVATTEVDSIPAIHSGWIKDLAAKDPAAVFVRMKRMDGQLIRAARKSQKGLYGQAVASLPIVGYDESWGWLDPASLNADLIRGELSDLFNTARKDERTFRDLCKAVSLHLVYGVWHTAHGDDARYNVITKAKEIILADPIGWGEALKINLLINAGLIVAPQFVLGGLNTCLRKVNKGADLFSKGKSYKADLSKPLWAQVSTIYLIRSFSVVAAWPAAAGSYDLREDLKKLRIPNYREKYPIRVE